MHACNSTFITHRSHDYLRWMTWIVSMKFFICRCVLSLMICWWINKCQFQFRVWNRGHLTAYSWAAICCQSASNWCALSLSLSLSLSLAPSRCEVDLLLEWHTGFNFLGTNIYLFIYFVLHLCSDSSGSSHGSCGGLWAHSSCTDNPKGERSR